eukprot:1225727-Rhodomonas_salina.1
MACWEAGPEVLAPSLILKLDVERVRPTPAVRLPSSSTAFLGRLGAGPRASRRGATESGVTCELEAPMATSAPLDEGCAARETPSAVLAALARAALSTCPAPTSDEWGALLRPGVDATRGTGTWT